MNQPMVENFIIIEPEADGSDDTSPALEPTPAPIATDRRSVSQLRDAGSERVPTVETEVIIG